MIDNRWRKSGRRRRESGQALVFMVPTELLSTPLRVRRLRLAAAINTTVNLCGNSGAGTIVGQIIGDQARLGGTSGITMDLNPTGSFSLMKATLLR